MTNSGKVYVWGLGFKLETIKQPKHIFTDGQGISELKMGLMHGVYIQQKNKQAYSWGDNTFGQTGNDYSENTT